MPVDHEIIGPDTPLRLEDAVRRAFPAGGITVAGLRKEAARGRLKGLPAPSIIEGRP